jgi:hypothetical protein
MVRRETSDLGDVLERTLKGNYFRDTPRFNHHSWLCLSSPVHNIITGDILTWLRPSKFIAYSPILQSPMGVG